MDALLKEIQQAKKRLPKSATQLKVLERILEQSKKESKSGSQSESQSGSQKESKKESSKVWKAIEGKKVLSKQEQIDTLTSKQLLENDLQ